MARSTSVPPDRLVVSGLVCGYGALPVVLDLDLTVGTGEVVALLGANGAGKSTVLRTLAGAIPPLGGVVTVDGATWSGPLHRRTKAGLAYVAEGRSILRGLTITENLRVFGVAEEVAFDLFPELAARARVKAGLLSGGEQQMLSLSRALGREPTVLLADELSLGLAPLIVTRLLEAVRAAAATGVSVLLVEQHITQALSVADRAYVMRRGRVELEGPAKELLDRADDIEAAYLNVQA
jgi:branched-chain amino acid transport system ATP-binding protein